MVRHIVLWNLHEENKEENAAAIKATLEDLNGKIPGLRFLQVGRCYNGYDLCLYSEFDRRRLPRQSPAQGRAKDRACRDEGARRRGLRVLKQS